VLVFLLLFGIGDAPLGEEQGLGAPDPTEGLSDSLAAAVEVSVRAARQDPNADFMPDRVGDMVTVRGRTSVRQGVLPDPHLVFLQDQMGGIAVRLPEAATVQRGDSLSVTGVVRHQYGLARLQALDYIRFGAVSRDPAPTPLTASTARTEAYEGQLVQIRGRVAVNRSNEGGRYLLIEDRVPRATARLAVFGPTRRLDAIPLDGFEAGDRITVTGILGQYDDSPPYDAHYQVLPRDSEDLSGTAFRATYYQMVILLFVAGTLLAVVAVFTLRVAVRRRTEQLAESRSRFRRLAEATFEGIIIHEDGDILDVNRALTRMTGYDRSALVGRSFLDVLSESTRGGDRTGRHAGPDEPYEAVVVRADGTTFPAEIEEKVVDAHGRRVRVAAMRDVTERKKWERKVLRAKEEAEEMARLKSSLLNNMSHELRTPITSIIGYAELILNEPEEDHGDFAVRIRKSGRRLSRTLRSVLEMAQIESGTLDVEPAEVDVRRLVREVVENHRSMAEQKALPLQVEAQEGPVSLYTDRTLVRRILSNLVHNAIKFTEAGQVRVRADSKKADSKEKGIVVSVADTGIGIGPDFREHLFEPFTQESDGRARTHEGTGLGLALTKRMVDLLGGDIAVESTPGDGTTVVVDLPPIGPDEAGTQRLEGG